jgi:hypothetical protein
VPLKRKGAYEKYGNHYQDARRTEVGMESRNGICTDNEKGDL